MKKLIFVALLLFSFPAIAKDASNIPPPREVYLQGDVDDRMAFSLTRALRELDNQAPGVPIIMHITSRGGSVVSGMMIINTMEAISSPVVTICEGYCASMGAFILASGDLRTSLPDSLILVHGISGGVSGKIPDMEEGIKLSYLIQAMIYKIVARHSGHTVEEITEMCSFENWMVPQIAKNKGLIDQIIQPVQK